MRGVVKGRLKFFWFTCGIASFLVAQDADERWKRDNDKGNRYEGLVNESHGLSNYELLGFFAYRERVSLDLSDSLKIRFYLPDLIDKDPFVSAREINSEKQYLMIAKKMELHPGDWSEFSGWDVRRVLRKEHIRLDNLGVIVRLKGPSAANQELAPAIFLSAVSPVPKAIVEYTLILTADAKLSRVDYEVIGSGGAFERFTTRKAKRFVRWRKKFP